MTRSFDLLARPYHLVERLTFGRALHRARTHLLPHLLLSRNALLLGDGDGRFLHDLLRSAPALHAHAVDSSPAMLQALSRRCASLAPDRLQTTHADALALHLPPGARFDLVCTHFFLDCLSTADLDQLLRNLGPNLSPGALWVLSDFRIPPRRGPARTLARLLVRSLYLAFGLLTGLHIRRLPDHARALTQAGFHLRRQHLSLAGLLTSELWQLPASNSGMTDPKPARDFAPIETAYDIDPLIPLPSPPNPLPADVERDLIDHPGPERDSN